MSTMISPDTSLAVMQAGQNETGRARGNLEGAIKAQDMERIEKAAKEFEAVFVSEMLKPMFEGIGADPLFGGGRGEEVFQGLMVQEYGKKLSQSGGLGIADKVKAEMIRLQEEANGQHANNNRIAIGQIQKTASTTGDELTAHIIKEEQN